MRKKFLPSYFEIHDRYFASGFILAILLLGGIWYIWDAKILADLIPSSSLWITSGLTVLNLALSVWLLKRERFASFIILGATIIMHLMSIIFLSRF